MQVESDFYLDCIPNGYVTPLQRKARYLCLAGNICPLASHRELYRKTIEYCAQTWEHVFVVLGNREYYCYSTIIEPDNIPQIAREICGAYPNVHLLDRDVVVIDGLKIAGCTLWSPGYHKDYRYIQRAGYKDIQSWHQRDLTWLAGTEADVYITHYPQQQPKLRSINICGHDNIRRHGPLHSNPRGFPGEMYYYKPYVVEAMVLGNGEMRNEEMRYV